jgi:cellulose synthase/poly-beta-1,6-N-acetylglucosamine synthase-like glycosyltransferase
MTSAALAAISLLLAAIHFGFPAAYFAYLKIPRGLRALRDASYRPRVAVIVPTYMEADRIERKLDEIYSQDYPRDRLKIVVVDGASPDGTAEAADRWARAHNDVEVVVVREQERRGKGVALNEALKYADGDVVVLADADASWAGRDALAKAVSYLADPSVGGVTCVKSPAVEGPAAAEAEYRRHYDSVRIAESAVFSTPIFHGELAAVKRKLVDAFPTDLGADDSWTAVSLALRGYRAIAAPDVECVEAVPKRGYFRWRVRRAQHLIQAFAKALPRIPKAPRGFRAVLASEAFLHLVNPWLFAGALAAATAAAAAGSRLAIALLAAGAAALALPLYRSWLVMQIALITAAVRNIWKKELIWRKEEK